MFEHIWDREPESTVSNYTRGLISQSKKQYKEALELFEKGLEQHPGFMECHYGIFFLYIETGELEKAQAAIEEALKHDS